MRVDLNENALCGVDVDLQESRLVERRVEQREQALGTQALASASASPLQSFFAPLSQMRCQLSRTAENKGK